MKAAVQAAVWAGSLSTTALVSLVHDALGKELSLRLMDSTWVSWKITVPIALFQILLSIALVFYALYRTTWLDVPLAQSVYRAAWKEYRLAQLQGLHDDRVVTSKDYERLMDAIQPWTTKSGKPDKEWQKFFEKLPALPPKAKTDVNVN